MDVSPKIEALGKVIATAEDAFYVGKYEEALERLEFFWDFRDPTSIPKKPYEFSDEQYAELLYQCGINYGFYTTAQRSSQKWSKDLLTKAYEKFTVLNDSKRQASSANYLATSYWRMGSLKEAEIWIEMAENGNTQLNDVFAETLIAKLLVSFSKKTYDYSEELFEKYESFFKEDSNLYFLSNFYNHRGLVKSNSQQMGEAILDYKMAVELFSEIKHLRFLSTVYNNMAWAYQRDEQYDNALASAFDSLDTADRSNDIRQKGAVYDTIAQFKLKTENYYESIGFSKRAIEHLSKTEAYEYLIEAYETKIKTLFCIREDNEARDVFKKAKYLAETQTSKEIVDRLNETYISFGQKHVRQKVSVAKIQAPSFPIDKIKKIYKKSVYSGNYQEGLECFDLFWDYKQPLEYIQGNYDEITLAELYFVCGDLYGQLHVGKADEQNISTKMLQKAFELFEKLGESARCAECANRLSASYHWLNESSESEKYLKLAFSVNKEVNEKFLYSIILDILYKFRMDESHGFLIEDSNKFRQILKEYKDAFLESGNDYLIASFYHYRGGIRQNLGFPNVIEDYRKAFKYFCKTENVRNQIHVINNIAYYYKTFGKYELAQEFAESALKLGKEVNDARTLGSIYDTLALIKYDNKNYEEALKLCDYAIEKFKERRSTGHILEAYETKYKILYSLNRVPESLEVFSKAQELANEYDTNIDSKLLLDKYAELINSTEFIETFVESEEFTGFKEFDLNLPEDLDKSRVTIVTVSTENFADYGILPGHFMAVYKLDHSIELDAFPLIAVSKISDHSVKIGYGEFLQEGLKLYLQNSGRVSIKFDSDYTVLGEVVGYFRGSKHKDKFIPIKKTRRKKAE